MRDAREQWDWGSEDGDSGRAWVTDVARQWGHGGQYLDFIVSAMGHQG